MDATPPRVIELDGLDALIRLLVERGFTVVGPSVEDGVIDYRRIRSAADLPIGWRDAQEAGRYRATDDSAERDGPRWVFGFATAAQSPKRWVFPPTERVLHATRTDAGKVTFVTDGEEDGSDAPLAIFGVRACELHAMASLDRVLGGGLQGDEAHRRRRSSSVLIAVECGHPGGTCFCTSMGTGPRVVQGSAAAATADIVLTEVPSPIPDDPRRTAFVARWDTEVGRILLASISARPATAADAVAAHAATDAAEVHMGRSLDEQGLAQRLLANPTHPAWEETAERCLACGNCTMVCPTCFCTTTRDTSDLAGLTAERWRDWDTCFSLSFTELHGGAVRTSVASRYRQWATHKLATWYDQFGRSGCVGCGRCITWCPVGIDLTEHARQFANAGTVRSRGGAR